METFHIVMPRLEICQNFYTTIFLCQKLYTLKMRKWGLILPTIKQQRKQDQVNNADSAIIFLISH